jgi:hypothetical protein
VYNRKNTTKNRIKQKSTKEETARQAKTFPENINKGLKTNYYMKNNISHGGKLNAILHECVRNTGSNQDINYSLYCKS